jgi:hypothetical protein
VCGHPSLGGEDTGGKGEQKGRLSCARLCGVLASPLRRTLGPYAVHSAVETWVL